MQTTYYILNVHCLTTSFQRAYGLENVEPSSGFREQISNETNTTPYLQDNFSSQAIPVSEGNYDYGWQREIPDLSQINDDGQWRTALQQHLEGSHNKGLPYNLSMGSLAVLRSSDFLLDGATQDGKISPFPLCRVSLPEDSYGNDTRIVIRIYYGTQMKMATVSIAVHIPGVGRTRDHIIKKK